LVQVDKTLDDASTDPYVYEQYVWDIRYIDSPIYRLRDDSPDGNNVDPGLDNNTLNETLYYTTDANMNVTALIDGDQTR
jgi:hypothetical protein